MYGKRPTPLAICPDFSRWLDEPALADHYRLPFLTTFSLQTANRRSTPNRGTRNRIFRQPFHRPKTNNTKGRLVSLVVSVPSKSNAAMTLLLGAFVILAGNVDG